MVEAWRRRRLFEIAGRSGESSATELVNHVEYRLRGLCATLHSEYGTPHLGNFSDPTDEFVYIILSRKTPERAYLPAFRALKAVGDWNLLAEMSEVQIAQKIHGCGLERKKAAAILAGLRETRTRLGSADFERARALPDEDLYRFLSALPEVGPKSSLCVMLYSFGRPVFPVDAHVGRVLARLGTFLSWGMDLHPADHKVRQRVLADAVPPDLRYSLHVNLVSHGRVVCRSRAPHCSRCMIATSCVTWSGHLRTICLP